MRNLFAVMAFAIFLLTQAPAAKATTVLDPWDAQLYAAAFDATVHGRFDEADDHIFSTGDELLKGTLLAEKYLHKKYTSSFAELQAWLQAYPDHPHAMRIYKLAMRKKPTGTPAPKRPEHLVFRAPSTSKFNWSADANIKNSKATFTGAGADAFFKREDARAFAEARTDKNHWIAGLAAYRLRDYQAAQYHFEKVAMDEREGSWQRAGGAFWAARATIAAGTPRFAPDFLRLAARWPLTFYGQIAERQLGLSSGTGAQADTAALTDGEFERLSRSFPQTRRAAALAQIGQNQLAKQEVHLAIALSGQSEKNTLNRFGTHLGLKGFGNRAGSAKNRAELMKRYPLPNYAPQYGYMVDRALVFAIARQESRFNPKARSPSGARGLMQLLPSTAAWIAKNASYKASPETLYDPATNLHVGQLYIRYLMETADPEMDIVRAVAAYNAGPGAFNRWSRAFDQNDVLMIIESLPSYETRDYVEKVLSNYWIYRGLLGQSTPTLDAIAAGVPAIFVNQDDPSQTPRRVASLPLHVPTTGF